MCKWLPILTVMVCSAKTARAEPRYLEHHSRGVLDGCSTDRRPVLRTGSRNGSCQRWEVTYSGDFVMFELASGKVLDACGPGYPKIDDGPAGSSCHWWSIKEAGSGYVYLENSRKVLGRLRRRRKADHEQKLVANELSSMAARLERRHTTAVRGGVDEHATSRET